MNFSLIQDTRITLLNVSDDVTEDALVARKLPKLLAQLDQNSSSPKSEKMPEIARAFEAFVKRKTIVTCWEIDSSMSNQTGTRTIP